MTKMPLTEMILATKVLFIKPILVLANSLLHPLALALDSASPKIAKAALDCAHKLLSHGLLRCEIDRLPDPPPHDAPSASRLLDSACRCGGLGDEAVELALLRALLSFVRSPSVFVGGESLVQIVKTCFNVYLGNLSGTNQICAKAVLAQILTIVYARVDADSIDIAIPVVSVGELMELSNKSLNDLSLIQFVQNFINDLSLIQFVRNRGQGRGGGGGKPNGDIRCL